MKATPYLCAMKNLILLLLLACPAISWAQTKREGIALYEMKRDLHASLTKEQEQYKSMMPQYMTVKFDYVFNAKESIFKYNEDEEEEDENSFGARIKMMRPNLEVYLNQTEKIRTEMRGFFGKDYLIESEIKNHAWKLTDETTKIGDYVCKKATCTDNEGKPVTAWYAENLPVFMGPMGYSGLPGLILKLETDNGASVFEMKKITFQKNKEGSIAKPTKGKKVTEAEFEEELKKMKAEGKGKSKIKIQQGGE